MNQLFAYGFTAVYVDFFLWKAVARTPIAEGGLYAASHFRDRNLTSLSKMLPLVTLVFECASILKLQGFDLIFLSFSSF